MNKLVDLKMCMFICLLLDEGCSLTVIERALDSYLKTEVETVKERVMYELYERQGLKRADYK